MTSNTQTATASKSDIAHRYTGIIKYSNGQELYLDSFYKTEKAARNAVIRARARLKAAGISVVSIRTACLTVQVTGWSSPIGNGVYPSDFSGSRDRWLADYFS